MTNLDVREVDVETAALEESIASICGGVELCSVATVDRGQPWVATMYFAMLELTRFVVVTSPGSRHFGGLGGGDDRVAVAVYDSAQDFAGRKRGIQAEGRARQLLDDDEIVEGIGAYVGRFPSADAWLSGVESLANLESRLFEINLTSVKVFDEVTFGPERWITATVVDPGLQ